MKQILAVLLMILAAAFSSCTGQKTPEERGNGSQIQNNDPQIQGSGSGIQNNDPEIQGNGSEIQDNGSEIQGNVPDPATGVQSDASFLLGYWQCGYSYYLEVTDQELILRDSRKRLILQTDYQVQQEKGTWYFLPEDPCLTYDYLDQPYGEVTQLYYKDGKLHLFHFHNYNPDEIKEEVFESVEEGPFADIIIRDGEFLDELQGKWKEDPNSFYTIYIDGNHMAIGYEEEETGFVSLDEIDFHVISYRYFPESVRLIHSDLVETEFYAFTQFDYEDGTLRANEMVLDADWDTSVTFVRIEE